MQNYTEINMPLNGKLLYLAAAPVAIIDSKLIHWNNGNVYAALTLKNLSPKRILSVKISLDLYDIESHPLRGVEDYALLDLSVPQGEVFAASKLIPLTDNAARNFRPRISVVVFEDLSKWTNSEAFTVIDDQKPLQEVFTPEDAAAYICAVSAAARFVPEERNEFWRCACGCVNAAEEAVCRSCGAQKEKLFALLDPNALAQAKQEFEASRAAAQAQEQEDREKQAQHCRKLLITIAVTLVLTIVGTIIGTAAYKKPLIDDVEEYLENDKAYEALQMMYYYPSIRSSCKKEIFEYLDIEKNEKIKDIESGYNSGSYYEIEFKDRSSVRVYSDGRVVDNEDDDYSYYDYY